MKGYSNLSNPQPIKEFNLYLRFNMLTQSGHTIVKMCHVHVTNFFSFKVESCAYRLKFVRWI